MTTDSLIECPTQGVCPPCREGWGHWSDGKYEPTQESTGWARECGCPPTVHPYDSECPRPAYRALTEDLREVLRQRDQARADLRALEGKLLTLAIEYDKSATCNWAEAAETKRRRDIPWFEGLATAAEHAARNLRSLHTWSRGQRAEEVQG